MTKILINQGCKIHIKIIQKTFKVMRLAQKTIILKIKIKLFLIMVFIKDKQLIIKKMDMGHFNFIMNKNIQGNLIKIFNKEEENQ